MSKKSYFKGKKKKESNKGKILITVLTALLMITSIMGFLNGGGGRSDLTYNGVRFTQVQGGWIANLDDGQVNFYYNPLELESVNMSQEGIDQIMGSTVAYLTFDPDYDDIQFLDLARFELSQNTENLGGVQFIQAVSVENSSYNLPVIDCRNATSSVPVVYFNKAQTTSSEYQNNCLIIKAPSAQIQMRMKDRLMYGLLGIIKNE